MAPYVSGFSHRSDCVRNRVAESRLELADCTLIAALAGAESLGAIVHGGVLAATFVARLDGYLDAEVAFFALFHESYLWLAGISESATCLLYCIRLLLGVLRARNRANPLTSSQLLCGLLTSAGPNTALHKALRRKVQKTRAY